MTSNSIPYFSSTEISQKISMKKAIALMAETYKQISSGEAQVPIRTHIHMPKEAGQALFMPAYLSADQKFGIKIVGIHDRNEDKGLPYIHALVVIMDAKTGMPLALADGTYITALRTGAGSGVATDLLARKDARVLAVFGAGVQARTQVDAVLAVRNIEEVYVFNRSPAKADKMIQEMQHTHEAGFYKGKPGDLSQADIICTATSATQPLFLHGELKKGVHINAIGAYRPDMAEIPADTIVNSSVFVDQIQAIWAEAGDLIQPLQKGLIHKSHVKGEIGQIVLQEIEARTSVDEITLFKSVGNAAQDIAVVGKLVDNEGKGLSHNLS